MVEDPKSFEDLRTVIDNEGRRTVYNTFLQAARARGLMEDDQMWERTIVEAFTTQVRLGQRIRYLAVFFATTRLNEPIKLLETIMALPTQWLTTPILARATPAERLNYVLKNLEWFLRATGVRPDDEPDDDGNYESACEHIGLPRPEGFNITRADIVRVLYSPLLCSFTFFLKMEFWRDDYIREHVDNDLLEENERRPMRERYADLYDEGPRPDQDQQTFIDNVLEAVDDVRKVIDGEQAARRTDIDHEFMLTGEGGSGKTFSYNVILSLFVVSPSTSFTLRKPLLAQSQRDTTSYLWQRQE